MNWEIVSIVIGVLGVIFTAAALIPENKRMSFIGRIQRKLKKFTYLVKLFCSQLFKSTNEVFEVELLKPIASVTITSGNFPDQYTAVAIRLKGKNYPFNQIECSEPIFNAEFVEFGFERSKPKIQGAFEDDLVLTSGPDKTHPVDFYDGATVFVVPKKHASLVVTLSGPAWLRKQTLHVDF